MSFELTKLLSLLLYPLSQALLLCLLSLLLMVSGRVRGAGISLLSALAWLYLCSTAYFADFMMSTLERDFPSRAISVIGEADAIVVLGGATRGDTHMSTLADLNQHADRLVYATALYKAGKAPVVLASGGAEAGSRPEAQMMRDTLEVMGVPHYAVLLEERSRDTRDNARYSAELLEQRGMKRILLVTSAFHLRRAKPLFTARGLEVVAAPTDYQRLVTESAVPAWLPLADDLARTTIALREHAGFWVYRLRNWL